jgi:hypothetical protein
MSRDDRGGKRNQDRSMKIVDSGRTRAAGSRHRVGSGEAGGKGFAEQLGKSGEAPAATSAGAPPSLAALGSILSVQEIPDALAERRRAVRRGDGLLDELTSLQIGLVEGWLPEATLRNLVTMLDRPRPPIDDPALDRLVGDIELRAAVEVAKLDRRRED